MKKYSLYNTAICVLLVGFFLAGCDKDKDPLLLTNKANNLSAQQVNDETDLTAQPISNAPEDDKFLTNVEWKLKAIFDAETDALIQELEPKDWEDSYTIIFYDNLTLMGKGVINSLHGSYLRNLNQNTSMIDLSLMCMTYANHIYDEEFYLDIMNKVDSYSVTEDNLKLYYDNQNYLLFERK
ncbi:MAG: hypothetical protein LBH82_03965 [Bacteroidales bacterium]|jgi:PBP1b-binding outer membrane lipoprotein LpoB|nr:hypothetical protein [Bacteroidales bacterium]